MAQDAIDSQADNDVRDNEQAAEEPGPYGYATVRAIMVAIILSLLTAAWTKQAELVSLTSQISESTPPIASIMTLFLIPAIGGLLASLGRRLERNGRSSLIADRLKRLRLSSGEMLVVFVFVAITAAMPGVGLFRQVMPSLMAPQYFGQPTDHLTEMSRTISPHLAPTDPEVARVFWEGEDVSLPDVGLEKVPVIGGILKSTYHFLFAPMLVPWQHWLVPFLWWSFYLSAYFITAFCLVLLFRRAWEQDEHLNFPVSNFAVEMIDPDRSQFSAISFFRDPVVWVGLSVAFIYNGANIIHVFNPGFPALGISYPIGQLFTEAPWDAMQGLRVFYKPELLGLGYLVPSDVLLTIWVFTLLAWFVRPLAKAVGYQESGFPFMTEQSMGAFIALGFVFIYQARERLKEAVKLGIQGAHLHDRDEPLSFRWDVIGAVVGAAVVIGMPIIYGVQWWVSLMYFGIMFLVLIVYSRNRAEMGFPIVWGYPLYKERATMVNFLGSRPFVGAGRIQSFTILTMFAWLQRSVNQAITAFGQESTVAAERLGKGRRAISWVVIVALVFGVVLAFGTNLSAFYEYGGLVLSSANGIQGGQMTQEVLGQYTAVSDWIDFPEDPDVQKVTYTTLGAVLALAMVVARRVWLRFPFHAGGYALAFTHSASYMWFPAFLLWTIKSLVLHVGGAGLYRRLARGFLAFTLGHFFAVGVWSLMGLTAGEVVRRYMVWFL